ncbi:MAG TPA: hypothetical protein VF721_11345 [Pyrinomonadaceae bacterium]|jgi:hypothetical protein
MAIFAMWIDGTSVVPEKVGPPVLRKVREFGREVDWSDIHGLRKIEGAKFRGVPNTRLNFHFPIPTPVIVPLFDAVRRTTVDRHVAFERAFLLFEGVNATIDTVNIKDGNITVYDSTQETSFRQLTGDHLTFGVSEARFEIRERTPTRNRIEVKFDATITVTVGFANTEDNYINFARAGMDFFVI